MKINYPICEKCNNPVYEGKLCEKHCAELWASWIADEVQEPPQNIERQMEVRATRYGLESTRLTDLYVQGKILGREYNARHLALEEEYRKDLRDLRNKQIAEKGRK